jgi:hypothetical protein
MTLINSISNLFRSFTGRMRARVRLIFSKKARRLKAFTEMRNLYYKKEKIIRGISFKNIDKHAIYPEDIIDILDSIETLLAKQLADEAVEEGVEDEILAELAELNSEENKQHTLYSVGAITTGINREEHIRYILIKLKKILRLEMQALRLIREKIHKRMDYWNNTGSGLKDMLQLFTLVYHHEDFCYKAFSTESKDTENLLGMILLEQDIEEAEFKVDERLFKLLIARMEVPETEEMKHEFRYLGENIFIGLFEAAGSPFKDYASFEKGFEDVKRLMNDDALMMGIIRKIKPEYKERSIIKIMHAFRLSFHVGHFFGDEHYFEPGQTA